MSAQTNTHLNNSKSENEKSNSTEILTIKMERLKSEFKKYDINSDDYIDYEELINFLDSLMKNGKKFDRNITKDIFKILDLNNDKKITVGEFLKTFIGIFDTIYNQIKLLEIQLISDRNKKKELEFSIRDFINEPINEEELSPNSKFILEITNIEFLKEYNSYSGISIIIKFDDQIKNTKTISKNGDLFWKEKFELYNFSLIYLNFFNMFYYHNFPFDRHKII